MVCGVEGLGLRSGRLSIVVRRFAVVDLPVTWRGLGLDIMVGIEKLCSKSVMIFGGHFPNNLFLFTASC